MDRVEDAQLQPVLSATRDHLAHDVRPAALVLGARDAIVVEARVPEGKAGHVVSH